MIPLVINGGGVASSGTIEFSGQYVETLSFAVHTPTVGDSIIINGMDFNSITPLAELIRKAAVLIDCDENIVYRDLEIGTVIENPEIVNCQELLHPELVVGYIQECSPFDLTVPVSATVTFAQGPDVSTISSTPNVILLLDTALLEAQQYQAEQERLGHTITEFIINVENGDVYRLLPSARIFSTTTEITFNNQDVVAWPTPDLIDVISTIEYSKFDDCTCNSIEMVQTVDSNGNVTLLNVVDPYNVDAYNQKLSVSRPFTFGTVGPFTGPCPPDSAVIDVKPICCNNDLENNHPDIAVQRLAWLDNADPSLMTPQGGTIGTAADGDPIEQVNDKLGGTVNFEVPDALFSGDDGSSPPFFLEHGVNGLSVLEFVSAGGGTSGSRLRLDTDNAPGSSFTCFYLFSTTVSGVDHQAILSVGPNAADGDQFHTDFGSWQFSRDSNLDSFIFRVETPDTPNIIFQRYVGAGDGNFGDEDDRTIVPLSQAYDGQLHLLTATYDALTSTLHIFFDGQIQLILDYTPAPDVVANMASDYFRVFGNRNGNAFGDGVVAEWLFFDTMLPAEDVAIVNSYLICKWGIDPSLAAGGSGVLELEPPGTFTHPSPLVQITLSDGRIVYLNTDTGLEYPVPPVPGLSLCTIEQPKQWVEILCDVEDANSTKFQRCFTKNEENIVTFQDLDFDGQPYTVQGNAQECCEDIVKVDCFKTETQITNETFLTVRAGAVNVREWPETTTLENPVFNAPSGPYTALHYNRFNQRMYGIKEDGGGWLVAVWDYTLGNIPTLVSENVVGFRIITWKCRY